MRRRLLFEVFTTRPTSSGRLIQAASGSRGAKGGRPKRSGVGHVTASRTAWRLSRTSSARPPWTSAGVWSAIPE